MTFAGGAYVDGAPQPACHADALRPMLGADADYLHAGLAALEAQHGSVNAYLEECWASA